jgi:hypothetical protein
MTVKKTESLVIGVYFNFSYALSNEPVWGVGDHGLLDNTALHKLFMRKTGLRERKFMRYPSLSHPSPKIHTFLEIKPLHWLMLPRAATVE